NHAPPWPPICPSALLYLDRESLEQPAREQVVLDVDRQQEIQDEALLPNTVALALSGQQQTDRDQQVEPKPRTAHGYQLDRVIDEEHLEQHERDQQMEIVVRGSGCDEQQEDRRQREDRGVAVKPLPQGREQHERADGEQQGEQDIAKVPLGVVP